MKKLPQDWTCYLAAVLVNPRSSIVRVAAVLVAVLAVGAGIASPASALTTPTATVGTSTLNPGGATTVTVTFANTAAPAPLEVEAFLRPKAGTSTTGGVLLSGESSTGPVVGCVLDAPNDNYGCLWSGAATPPQTVTLSFTVTVSSDALGTFEVVASVASGGSISETVVAEIVVQPAPTTTTTLAPTTTVGPSTTAGPTTTNVTGLPVTGSGTPVAVTVSLVLFALGGLLLLARRRPVPER